MNNNKRILHLTDFHLHDIETTGKEHLRKDFYRTSYLPNFFKLIQSEIGKIDCIIATGDFVEKGNKNNFSHAKEILEFIAKELNLSNRNVGICIGNHDLNKDLDFNGKLKEAREDYFQFSQNFANGVALKSFDRFCICNVSENTIFLSLDSTLNRQCKEQPGLFIS